MTVMTDDSVSNLDSAMKSAKDVWNNTASTDDELKAAINDLQKAMDGLVEKPSGLSPAVIIGIAAAVIVVIIVVAVLIVVSSGKKKKKNRSRERKTEKSSRGWCRKYAETSGISGFRWTADGWTATVESAETKSDADGQRWIRRNRRFE